MDKETSYNGSVRHVEWRFTYYECVLLMIAQIFRYINFCLGYIRI